MLGIQCIRQAATFPDLVSNRYQGLLDAGVLGQFQQHLQRTVQRQAGSLVEHHVDLRVRAIANSRSLLVADDVDEDVLSRRRAWLGT